MRLLQVVGTIAILAARSQADLIYSGTGYPDILHTDGHPELLGTHRIGLGGLYGVSGVRVTLAEPTLITGMNGVTSTDQGVGSVVPFLNVFAASGSMSREQAFAATPLNGNVLRTQMSFSASPLPFGTSLHGYANTYVTLDCVPFTLDAGDYIFAPVVDVTAGSWNWSETDLLAGPGIYAIDTQPGQYFEYSQAGAPITTGVVAIDIVGHAVPAPGTIGIAVLAFAAAHGRRRLRCSPSKNVRYQ